MAALANNLMFDIKHFPIPMAAQLQLNVAPPLAQGENNAAAVAAVAQPVLNNQAGQPAGLQAPAATHENIVETGNIHYVIDYIDQNGPNPHEKIAALFRALSQTLSTPGQNRGSCDSTLKDRLFDYVQRHRTEAQTVLDMPRFKYDTQLADTIKKINYLTVGFGSYKNDFCNYTRRFWHHFGETYFKNKHFGGNYTVLGVTLIVGGILNGLTSDPNDPEQKRQKQGWAATSIGGGFMVLYPLAHVIYATTQDEP